MGTFGFKIFDDDFAQDVREMFLEKLMDGFSSEVATKEVLNENSSSISDSDENSVLWLSLAATQWEYGRLLDYVKNKALLIIDNEEDLIKWNFDNKRKKALLALRDKLISNQPKEKKISSKRFTLVEGDIFRFKIQSDTFVFGRVLTESYFLFYLYKSNTKNVSLENIIKNKTAFIAWCHDGGFSSRKWKIIGNIPLEDSLKKPIYFYHQSVEDEYCTVFNIWEGNKLWSELDRVHVDECKHLEHTGLHSPHHIVERLEVRFANEKE